MRDKMGIPIFFKLWFAFVGLLVLSVFSVVGYVGVQTFRAGPEGIGREVGAIVKGFNDSVNGR